MFMLGNCNDYIRLKRKYRATYKNFGFEWSLKEYGSLWVLDRLVASGCKRVLEFGVGFNVFFSEACHARGMEYWSVDRSDSDEGIKADGHRYRRSVETRVSRGQPSVEAWLGDGSADLPENYFDAVVSVSVVEHIDGRAMLACVKDAARVLAPGGWLLNSIDIYPESKKHQEWHYACTQVHLDVPAPHFLDWGFSGDRTTFLERQDVRYEIYNSLAGDPWARMVPYQSQFATTLHAAQKRSTR